MDNCRRDRCTGINGPSSPLSSQTSSGGFFSFLFGPSESCKGCGNTKCQCNCKLTQHLRRTAGYGQLPPLLEDCNDEDKCLAANGQILCSQCNQPTGEDQCIPTRKSCNICPPMPCTDCTECMPVWMKCAPMLTRTYPVPEGVYVAPISYNPRRGGGACKPANEPPKCGSCLKPEVLGAPPKRLSESCPMMKPRCPGDKGGLLGQQEAGSGAGPLAKLLSFFKK